MPAGPKGEKRPSDVIGNAVHEMRIATDEIEETIPDDGKDPAAKALGKKGGTARGERRSRDEGSGNTVGKVARIKSRIFLDADAPAKKRGSYRKTVEQISN